MIVDLQLLRALPISLSADWVQARVSRTQRNTLIDITKEVDLDQWTQLLGIPLLSAKIWYWHHSQLRPIHTDGLRKAALNYVYTPGSTVEFYTDQYSVSECVIRDRQRWSLHYRYPQGEPQPRSQWKDGWALLDTQQPHRVVFDPGVEERISITMTVGTNFAKASDQLRRWHR